MGNWKKILCSCFQNFPATQHVFDKFSLFAQAWIIWLKQSVMCVRCQILYSTYLQLFFLHIHVFCCDVSPNNRNSSTKILSWMFVWEKGNMTNLGTKRDWVGPTEGSECLSNHICLYLLNYEAAHTCETCLWSHDIDLLYSNGSVNQWWLKEWLLSPHAVRQVWVWCWRGLGTTHTSVYMMNIVSVYGRNGLAGHFLMD